jgi:general secretion pathway protein D
MKARLILLGLAMLPGGAPAQTPPVSLVDDSVMVRFSETDIRAAIQAIGRYLDKSVLTGPLPASRISFFETPAPVPRSELPTLLRGIVEAQGLLFTEEESFYRVTEAPPDPPTPRFADRSLNGQVATAPVELFVIRLKHARAADVAATINQLFATGGAFAGTPGLSAGTLSEELRREEARTLAPADMGTGPDLKQASLSSAVVMVPDDLTNSLLVRATQDDFDVLRQAVDQLDIRPLQVLVEVLIIEARKDRQFQFGVGLQVPPVSVDGGTVEGELPLAALGDLVVTVLGLGRYEINAIITAARRRGDVRIVSRPVVLASNNTEARLLVGSQRPFVQVSRSLATETPNRDQVVQYKDVGTKLTVRPTVNEDGYVSLMLRQEISQATEEVQFDAPVISTRETTTQVLVGDGQTLVIGGITDRQQVHTRSGVPILVDIPLIGGIFGSTATRTVETELFLFITPTILRDDADALRITRPRLPGDSTDVEAEPEMPAGTQEPDTTRTGHGTLDSSQVPSWR